MVIMRIFFSNVNVFKEMSSRTQLLRTLPATNTKLLVSNPLDPIRDESLGMRTRNVEVMHSFNAVAKCRHRPSLRPLIDS